MQQAASRVLEINVEMLCDIHVGPKLDRPMRAQGVPFKTPEEAATLMATTELKKMAVRRCPMEVYRTEG